MTPLQLTMGTDVLALRQEWERQWKRSARREKEDFQSHLKSEIISHLKFSQKHSMDQLLNTFIHRV